MTNTSKHRLVGAIMMLLMCAAWLYSAAYPSAVATDANLLVARNRAASTLSGNLSLGATTFNVASASSFASNMVVSIDTEDIFCTTFSGTTFSGCTRGYGGSTAASHTASTAVRGAIVATHHNALADEVKAIQTALGANMVNVPAAAGLRKFSCTVSPVVCTLYDDTATTGVSALEVRAGAGQNRPMFCSRNNAAVVVVCVLADGSLGAYGTTSGGREVNIFGGTGSGDASLQLANDALMCWRSAATLESGSPDVCLFRNAAGVIEVNNGVGNTYRDMKLRAVQTTDNTEATCDATTRGTINNDQGGAGVADIVRICVKDAADAYAWVPLF